MIEYLIVFLWGFIPTTLWLGYHVVYIDMWKERWNGKYRCGDECAHSVPCHSSNLEAFLWNFIDDSTPTVIWWRVVAVPFVVGIVVSYFWWLIYVTVEVAA